MSTLWRKKKKGRTSPQWKIKRECLDLILECSKSNYPNEFGGLLRVDALSKNTIIEVVILPGTISGDSHAIFKLHMLPIDFSMVGTVHSHPSLINMVEYTLLLQALSMIPLGKHMTIQVKR